MKRLLANVVGALIGILIWKTWKEHKETKKVFEMAEQITNRHIG